jgi:hypothetical protein
MPEFIHDYESYRLGRRKGIGLSLYQDHYSRNLFLGTHDSIPSRSSDLPVQFLHLTKDRNLRYMHLCSRHHGDRRRLCHRNCCSGHSWNRLLESNMIGRLHRQHGIYRVRFLVHGSYTLGSRKGIGLNPCLDCYSRNLRLCTCHGSVV